jgi:hypothetical protein
MDRYPIRHTVSVFTFSLTISVNFAYNKVS